MAAALVGEKLIGLYDAVKASAGLGRVIANPVWVELLGELIVTALEVLLSGRWREIENLERRGVGVDGRGGSVGAVM